MRRHGVEHREEVFVSSDDTGREWRPDQTKRHGLVVTMVPVVERRIDLVQRGDEWHDRRESTVENLHIGIHMEILSDLLHVTNQWSPSMQGVLEVLPLEDESREGLVGTVSFNDVSVKVVF